MARPSSGSLYFSDVAAQAQANLRRKSALHESWVESESRRSTGPDEGFETMKHKYILQNKSLAQKNAAMALKLSEMETKISELMNENMSLKKRKSVNDQEYKKKLEKKLVVLERGLINKVDEIFQVFRDVRKSEGLPANPQFESLNEFTRPVTSTPIDDSDRDLFGGNFELLRLSAHKELRDLSFPDRRLRSRTPEITPNVSVLVEASDEMTAEETILGIDDKTEVPITKLDILPDSLRFIVPNENTERKEQAKQAKQMKEKVLAKQRKENEKTKSKGENEQTEYKDGQSSAQLNLSRKNSGSKESIPQAQNKEPKPTSAKAKPPSDKLEITSSRQSSPLDSSESEVRRSSRVKEKVSYTAPSLRKKMRRESEKFVDAVGGFTPIKIEPRTNENDHSVKRARSIEELDKSKRKPLSNVTGISNQTKRPTKASRMSLEESIFDFTDDKPRASKRYSMI